MSKDLKDTKNLLEVDYEKMEREAALIYVEERAKLSLESREERAIRKACDFGKNYGVHTHPPSLSFPKVPIDVGFSKTVKLVPSIGFSTKEPLPLKKEGLPDIERGYYHIFEIVGDRVYFENGFKVLNFSWPYGFEKKSPEKIFGMFLETLIHYFEEGKVVEGMTAFTPETPGYAVQPLDRMHRKKGHSKEYEELNNYYKNEGLNKEDVGESSLAFEADYMLSLKSKTEGIETGRISYVKGSTEERSRDKLPENSRGTKKR